MLLAAFARRGRRPDLDKRKTKTRISQNLTHKHVENPTSGSHSPRRYGPSPSIATGSRPSFSSFSRRIISSRLVAFLIFSCSLFRSASVSLSRESLDVLLDAP